MIQVSQYPASTRFTFISLLTAAVALFAPGLFRNQIHAASAHPALTDSENCDIDTSRLAPDGEEQWMLDQTNAYRAGYGLQPLSLSYALTVSAEWKATDMANRGYGAHDDGFRGWGQRFRDCGYDLPSAYMGENLAGGFPDAGDTLYQWEQSPAHNADLLNPYFTAVGIKRVQSTNPGDAFGWYWAMDLGSELDANLYDVLYGLGQ